MLTPATSAVDHFLARGHRSALVLGGDGRKEPLRHAVAQPEGGSAEVFETSVDRLGQSVGGAGAVEVVPARRRVMSLTGGSP